MSAGPTRASLLLLLVLAAGVEGASARQDVPLDRWQQRAAEGELEAVLGDLAALRNPSGDALRLQAWLLGCAGRHAEAIQVLDQLLQRSPADQDALRRRADAQWALGRFARAQAGYQEVARMETDPARRQQWEAARERLGALVVDQRALKASMQRLHAWYVATGVAALLGLLGGAVGALRVWRQG